METIIIWIVIVAVGAAYEWVKKKAAPSESEQHPPARTSRPAPCNAPWSTDRAMQQPARMQHEPRKPKPQKPAPAASAIPAPAHSYQPLTNLPANDTPMQVEELDNNQETPQNSKVSQQELAERQAHYDRWRKAILDTQILERKF